MLNKPAYMGTWMLQLSKVLIYEFQSSVSNEKKFPLQLYLLINDSIFMTLCG